VIPPLVDVHAFHPNGSVPAVDREPSSLRVLIAGPLEWTAGYEHGLQALALLRHRGVAFRCRVVGDGPHLSALLFARHQLGLTEHVRFEDRASPRALRRHREWADVFLAPTVIDGLPEQVVEACAAALCVVMSDPGRLGRLELDESVAITVGRRDPGALADALAGVAAEPALRAQIGAAARRWAREHFPLHDGLDRLNELHRRMLANRS
jgi:glycosyltransferase involved in cell wall biosynthesis